MNCLRFYKIIIIKAFHRLRKKISLGLTLAIIAENFQDSTCSAKFSTQSSYLIVYFFRIVFHFQLVRLGGSGVSTTFHFQGHFSHFFLSVQSLRPKMVIPAKTLPRHILQTDSQFSWTKKRFLFLWPFCKCRPKIEFKRL